MTPVDTDPFLLGILRTLRSSLNACPEAAGDEVVTSRVIASFLSSYAPDELITEIGGSGIAAIFKGKEAGPTLLIRCELDALVDEEIGEEDALIFPTISHKCGHDGHMAIVAGLAPILSSQRPKKGRVVLLFQPAEETGEGAKWVIEDSQFPSIRPDYAICLHNVPGFSLNQIVYRYGTISSASVGMRVVLEGIRAHAAEPSKARTPTHVIGKLISEFPALTNMDAEVYKLLTITHAQLGRETFGSTPGQAILCATLRSGTGEGLDELCRDAEKIVHEAACKDGLFVDISWVERFPAVRNDSMLVDELLAYCEESGLTKYEKKIPFTWSEDFGNFCQICPCLLFGMGAGEEAPRLHQKDYRFPDEIIETGLKVFYSMIERIMSK